MLGIIRMNMKNTASIYFILLIGLTISACQNVEQENQNTEQEKTKKHLFTASDIEAQVFSISTDKDTILIGKAGTVIIIEKNTFVDQNGNQPNGQIKIEFKECLDKLDMILGNLTTTSNGKFLESGGMIYINATSANQQLAISDNKTINVEINADIVFSDMQLFEGIFENNIINWINPSPLSPEIIQKFVGTSDDSIQVSFIQDTIYKKHNVTYNIDGFTDIEKYDEIPNDLSYKIAKKIWAGTGMVITKDSSMMVEDFKINLFKQDTFTIWKDYKYGTKWVKTETLNTFTEDQNTNYIFSIKKLGWANIDRFYSDPRTEEIELIARVNNYKDYEDIYISMVFKNQNMYLPGYQKKDNSFSFTHGDYEKTSLPVGEVAIILVTAYKDDRPYYAIKTFKIMERQTINFNLTATTKEDLKRELEMKI